LKLQAGYPERGFLRKIASLVERPNLMWRDDESAFLGVLQVFFYFENYFEAKLVKVVREESALREQMYPDTLEDLKYIVVFNSYRDITLQNETITVYRPEIGVFTDCF
jgi:hypothetical protein